MRKITFYSKPNCPLCDQARHHLQRLLPRHGGDSLWLLEEVNVVEDPDIYRRYRYVIPVVDVEGIGPLPAPASLDPEMLRRVLSAPPGDYALAAQAATLLQAGQFEAETTSLQNALRANTPAATAEEAQRQDLYEQLVNTIDAPLEALTGTVQAGGREQGAGDRGQGARTSQELRATSYEQPAAGHRQPRTANNPPAADNRQPATDNRQPTTDNRRGWSRRWLWLTNSIIGTFAILPWLAPVFARLGWWGISDGIYTFYMFFCHQLPERAGTLFGYQVAYCFRNSAIYGSIFFAGLLYAYARSHPRGFSWLLNPLPWQLFLLALVPMGLDGITHMLGLRENNAWFDALTGGAFGDFSVGDSLGTLNWWLRVTSGALMGFCAAWLVYPWIDRAVQQPRSPYPMRDYAAPLPSYAAPEM